MRLFGGQVHWAELLALAVFSFLSYAIGYSLPLFAAMLFFLWPLLLLQMLAEGAFWGVLLGVRKLWRRGKPQAPEPPPAPRRHGIARFLWFVPLITMTVGYLIQYRDTGTWFL